MTKALAALSAALVLLFPGAALSQGAPDCSAMTAEVDMLSARLSQASARSQAQMATALAEQERYAEASKRQSSSGAVFDVLAGAIDAVVPGAEQLGTLARMASPAVTRSPSAPDREMLADANAAMIAQGETAVRIGGLLERLRAGGCPGVTMVQP